MALFVFCLSLALSLLLVPLARRLSFRLGKVAEPSPDRWHQRSTPLLGGAAIFAAFLASLLVAWVSGGLEEVHWGLLAGSAFMFLLGLYDDFRPATPPTKLVGQIIAATVVVASGYTTQFFTPRLPDNIIAQIPNILLTFAWLVGITNAINLLDNMDGLAGGIALITAAILSFFFAEGNDSGLLMIALALAGSALGFLVYNFPPATVFMGDSGSLFLGFTLAGLAIARQPQASNVFAVIGVPTLLFLLPILDTVLVTFTRLLRGQSPAQGGRDHTSHRLIAFGLNERQAVLALYAVALVSGVLASTLESLSYWLSLVVVPVLLLTLALLTAYLGGLRLLSAPPAPGPARAITRVIMELTYRRRILEVILDFFVVGIAYYLAFLTRTGLRMNPGNLDLFLNSLPLALGGALLSFFLFGIYRGVWRYLSLDDLVRIFKAAVGGVALTASATWALYSVQAYPPVVFLLFGVFLFLGLSATRSSFRLLDRISNRQRRAAEERVLICGAGAAGELALRWILSNAQLEYRPVGILDDDPFLAGRQIHGVAVLGGLDQLETWLDRLQVDGVIVTGQALANGAMVDKVLPACRQRQCWVRSLKLEFSLVEGE